MKKKGYCEYDPVIYPRMLCVAIGMNQEDAIGMEHGGEPSAYLTGWIASCINKARLGIGDFVELKDKEDSL